MIRRPPRSTLFLHDALPISVLCADDPDVVRMAAHCRGEIIFFGMPDAPPLRDHVYRGGRAVAVEPDGLRRSEEHTSELQSHVNLVCRLLLEKKKDDT